MAPEVIRFSEHPELWEGTEAISREVWPEYNLHGEVNDWGRLFDDFPDFQFALYDALTREILAEGHTAPCPWDGTQDGLGEGIDDMLARAYAARARGLAPTALCALAAEVRPRFQGRRLANRVLRVMTDLGRAVGLSHLIAPVRPSWKERYPITPIERYVTWRREDGAPFDPWIRIHVRRGGRVVKPAPRSMYIAGSVADWEAWTGMQFPDDGEYVFPRGLAPVSIDRVADRGVYWEPNVWIVHTL